ncbi:aminopeptidase N [Streptomyces sp. NPDC006435]|uniref:aminopeptidase N n=1 Tax=Streptomyces sp. NPDC006435 TaxID=3154300 RepID=UPI0033A5029A
MTYRNLTREEAVERARLVRVERYDVELDLRSALRGGTFRSVTTVRFTGLVPGATTFVELVADAVHRIVFNGRVLDPAEVRTDSRIRLDGLAPENELLVVADCAYSNDGGGLHRFVDPVDSEVYLYTQFEIAEAQRVAAVFDQPDLKASFAVTVTVPAGWRVIGNSPPDGPARAVGTGEVHRFEPTPRIPSYLAAVVAGPYEGVTGSYRGVSATVPLGLYCRRSLARHLDAEPLLDLVRTGLAFYEQKLGTAYPFAKYDQVFVPEFNASAMENAAAVTVKDTFVFRSPADAEYELREMTILHELAHMWFGDLVTMRWWDDLWLNEAFATYAAAVCAAEAPGLRGPAAWASFANVVKSAAYARDLMPSAHPVAAEVADLDDVRSNFDEITYAKGAALLKQLAARVGPDRFFQGLGEYLRRHAWANATLDDLLAALSDGSGTDLRDWFSDWLRSVGAAVLRPEVESAEDGTIRSLVITQRSPGAAAGAARYPVAPQRHRVGLGLYEAKGARLVRTGGLTVAVDGPRTEVPELVGRPRPAAFVLNDDDLAYTRIRFDHESFAVLADRIAGVADPLARIQFWSAAWDMTRVAELPARRFVGLALDAAPYEPDTGLVRLLHRRVRLTLDLFADPAWSARGAARWADTCLDQVRGAMPGSERQLNWFRAFLVSAAGRHVDVLTALLGKDASDTGLEGIEVRGDVRWAVLARLAALGAADRERIDEEALRDGTATGRERAATCLAARPDPDAKAEAWAALTGDRTLSAAVLRALAEGFAQSTGQAELLAPYAERYFAQIDRWWTGQESDLGLIGRLYPYYRVTPELLELTDAWAARSRAGAAVARLLADARETVRLGLRARVVDRAADGAARPV